ncbi:hypothetical protein Tco_1113550 [Tanacetum coccineum]|uniref:Uncharacterized protein n=1 Tax=Tanacetum coccineum TaxID=301880 RepID=A0ABQ5IUU7_9ASTR
MDQYIFQRRIPVTEEASTRPSAQPEDDTSANIVHDTSSPINAEIGADTDKTKSEGDIKILIIGGKQGEDVANKHSHMEEDQAGPNPGQSHVALAGPNPEPIHEDFIAIMYPQVHKSLKHPYEEHVHLENPLSSSGTLSSMKNLENFTFGDQFIADKSSKDEPINANMETKVESMVTVPIHQASSFVPPLSTPIIDLSPPKPVSSPAQAPTFIATTTTTTTLPLQPLPQQQSSSEPDLASRVSALEQVCANFEKRHKLPDKTVQGLSSRVFTLELRDLPYKIDQTINEAVKEVVQTALQALLSLYEALEASMEHDNRDEFLAEKDKSQKKRRDDQDPPPPPIKESEQSKKKKQDSDASVDDIPILDVEHISYLENTGVAHLPKIKTRPNWLKPVPEEDRPKTPEPEWIGKSKLNKADLEGPAYKVVRAFHSNSISLQFQMEECHLLLTDQIDLVNPKGHRVVSDVSKPLPLGGRKERRSVLSISKLKAANYLDFGLEELIPSLANYQEYKISEADFKNLHPNDFEDMYLLHLQGKLNHLSGADKVHLFNAVNLWIRNLIIRKRVEDLQLRIESYQTKLNLTQPNWDASDFLFKEDYTIVSKPKVVIYIDGNDQKKMMRETEVHKFSDGTLIRVLEKLDHMVKDFRLFKYNPGMENRI